MYNQEPLKKSRYTKTVESVDVVYMMKVCGYTGRDFIDTIMHYRITYLPHHIVQLIDAKEEDPFDIEGIEKATMIMKDYNELKTYLVNEIRETV